MDNELNRISKALKDARVRAKVSQETMAEELMVARKTIQNWEHGVSFPDLEQGFGWFRVLGISPLPFLFQYVFPSMENLSANASDEELRAALFHLIEDMPMEGVRQLLYLFYGKHGNSPRAVMNMVTAHLQSPIPNRIAHGALILKDYELAKKMGIISHPEHVQPNIEMLKDDIAKAEELL